MRVPRSAAARKEMRMVGLIDSEWGIIIVLAVVVLVFGSSQLPKLARSLGSAQSEFKKGLSEGKKENEGAEAGDTTVQADKATTKDNDGSAASSG
jgi:sec-independent protein translocase protein TatA